MNQPIRDQLQSLIQGAVDRTFTLDEAMSKTDEAVLEMIGDDTKITDEMPVKWNETLRKQFVNFRNHKTREVRKRYWG